MAAGDELERFVRRGQTAQGLVDELLAVRGLSNAQLSQRLGVVIGEFLSRYPTATTEAQLYARLIELAGAVDAFTRELAAAAAARRP